MGVRDELRDPWGWLVAGVSGGLGWAALAGVTAAALPIGIAVGAAVLGTKVAIGSRTGRKATPSLPAPDPRRPDALPTAHPSSPAGRLLARADAAVARMQQLAATPGDPWLRAQVDSIDDEAGSAVASLRDVAGRVTLVEQSYAASDPRRLVAEDTRVRAELARTTDPRLRDEQARSLQSIAAQLEVAQRLDTLRATLLARMESAVLGLEGLSARMGEIVALGPTVVDHDQAAGLVDELTGELDTLRGGIDEAQRLSSRGLPGGTVVPPPGAPGPPSTSSGPTGP